MEEDNFNQIKCNPAEQNTRSPTCVRTLGYSVFAGACNMCGYQKKKKKNYRKTWKGHFINLMKCERSFFGNLFKMSVMKTGSTRVVRL